MITEPAQCDHMNTTGKSSKDATPELAEAILEEAAKLAADVLAPLNKSGDERGATLGPDGVMAANGFKSAYNSFVAGRSKVSSGGVSLTESCRSRTPGHD